ncbi:pyridoxal phosphate-dependent transferase [Talaromyces proteolyticus]|uniref:Pyridoxal phosphate-dependent transferase n=1 Tax=Talaromyces proteolyticus TaxID=1131652 RepID=A0AAD4KHM9_9EURO|nr:pyridoxal phosphate-dependent transferase [Talaromyces proteolyticus]KAH8692677.1 pyridoxal phosphate-dependent transferase [Talaromyces proteolyticus]
MAHPLSRADEVGSLLAAVQKLLIPFIRSADAPHSPENGSTNGTNGNLATSLVNHKSPDELEKLLKLDFPRTGQGQGRFLEVVQQILHYSVNTWHQGFLDKLYASTNAPGVAAELILAALNTNVHVYHVSPALTLIEKHTTKKLASLFGLDGPYSGGISVQGGSASNTTSIVIARNILYPKTKEEGNGSYKFVLFTSDHGHYSIEKASQMLGFGSNAVWSVPVDQKGRIIPSELENLIQQARDQGRTPFYVNATAGTTVLGSFDPFNQIADICQKYNLWLHVDGSWGGSFVFSKNQKSKLAGVEKANSIAINPHKMLGVPVTCSFLLAADLRQFHRANTLPAGYLFHSPDDIEQPSGKPEDISTDLQVDSPEVWDLADLTLQCGRRADSLKLFLSWTYYGSEGYERKIDEAADVASYLATVIDSHPDLLLLSDNPPPCLQVCFYYAPGKRLVYDGESEDHVSENLHAAKNSKVTEKITHALVAKGYMVDFAPPSSNDIENVGNGKFFRCVVNISTTRETIDGLIHAFEEVAPEVIRKLKG